MTNNRLVNESHAQLSNRSGRNFTDYFRIETAETPPKQKKWRKHSAIIIMAAVLLGAILVSFSPRADIWKARVSGTTMQK